MEEIQVEVQKNEIFELMMMWNKDSFLNSFEQERKEGEAYGKIKKNMYPFSYTASSTRRPSKSDRKSRKNSTKTSSRHLNSKKKTNKKRFPSKITVNTLVRPTS